MSIEDIYKDTKPKMAAVVDDLQRKLVNVRTGRASVGMLDEVTVDYYGVSTPLSQMASISVPEPQLLAVQPWDATQLNEIERAINQANLGMNPSNDGKIIRLSIPALTEERRKQMAKQVHDIAEEHRVAIRNIRHSSNDEIKKMLKEKEISEDNERIGLENVQDLTNDYVGKIDELAKKKEKEVMTV